MQFCVISPPLAAGSPVVCRKNSTTSLARREYRRYGSLEPEKEIIARWLPIKTGFDHFIASLRAVA